MRKLDVLVVFDSAGTPPDDQDFSEEFKKEEWYTEAAVIETLRLMGHNVRGLGIYDDIALLISELASHPADIVFNLTEIFRGQAHLDKNIPALLELMGVPYTGCGADGMGLCNNKALCKKILTYHRIKVPRFHTFRRGRAPRLPSALSFPLVVKPLREEASTGISQASYVRDEEHLRERVAFIHNKFGKNALVEEYVAGRELYVSIMGSRRLTSFPVREMVFGNVPDEEPRLATYSAKWDARYRERRGIANTFAEDLPADVAARIARTCRRAYRALNLDGYARFDCRLTPRGELYILEGNANPELAQGDEFAESARKAGCAYDRLLDSIIRLGLARE